MGLRPAHCYRGQDKPAYTRIAVTVHHKNFIGTNPNLKTRQFNMGNPLRKYARILDLVCMEPGIQIRDNAIEAARLNVNRALAGIVGKENFFMRLRVYPFHILRENKLAQGAGADRVSSGMKHAFGKPIGRAARLRKGQKIFSVLCDESQIENARKCLLRAIPKMGFKMGVISHADVESIGKLPKKVREEKVEEKKEETVAEGAAAPAEGAAAGEAKEGAEKEAGKETPAKAGEKSAAPATKTAAKEEKKEAKKK